MNSTQLPYIENSFFYRNQDKWIPIIAPLNAEPSTVVLSNVTLIPLSAHPDSDLLWEKQKMEAREVIKQRKLILWELDFGFSKQALNADDTAFFYSMSLAIEEFSSYLFKEFEEHTLGVVIYRGSVRFYEMIVPTESRKTLFIERLNDTGLQKQIHTIIQSQKSWPSSLVENPLFQFYAADVIAEYMQRLVAYLPDTVSAFMFLDATDANDTAMLAYLTSSERFPHIGLALKRSPLPAGLMNWEEGSCYGGWVGEGAPYLSTPSDVVVAVCLPSQDYFTSELCRFLQNVFHDLKHGQIPYRIIPESQLTDLWHGLDYIIVFSGYVSISGKRKLQGFCAAGGSVVHFSDRLEVDIELGYEEFMQLYVKNNELTLM